MRDLEIVPECNDEDTDEPRCWAIRSIFDIKACRYHYVWICRYDDKEYVIENSDGVRLVKKAYRTLQGAREKAESVLVRQEQTGLYTD